jgi:hypothetical protein
VEDKEYLKKFLTTPPVKKIDLHFPLGLEVTARNLKGVTIKDALDAIYKQFRKKVCDCRPSGYPESHLHIPTHSPHRCKESKLTTPSFRLMTNSKPPSSPASNGTKKSPGPA